MIRIFLALILMGLSSLCYSHGMSAEDQARILNAGYFEYLQLGASHMLSGYDHLLFLFGVIFFLSRFKDILKFITVFTIGHSITLTFATLLTIKANYYLVDALIALTVCYKAFDNLDGFKKYFQMASPSLIWMVFIFGLIHGFGLSTRLQQLPLGSEGLVLKILSFNAGVELGQIVALSFMLVVMGLWRKTESFTRCSKAANVGLMTLGALLFLMQMHGYQHSQFPDEYPINADDHAHIHEDMESAAPPLSLYPIQNTQPAPSETMMEQHNSDDSHSHDGELYHSHH